MRVRIKSCCFDHWWYRKIIGEEFDLDPNKYIQYIPRDTDQSGFRVADTAHNRQFQDKMGYTVEFLISCNNFVADIDCEPVTNRDAITRLIR